MSAKNQWVLSNVFGTIHMLILTVNIWSSGLLWWNYFFGDAKNGSFVKHSRTSYNYLFRVIQDGYWKYLCSKWKMIISVEHIPGRGYTIFQVFRTWSQLGNFILSKKLFETHRLISLKNDADSKLQSFEARARRSHTISQ